MTFHRQRSRRSMGGKLLLFTDSTFEEFQELEYDAAGKRNGPLDVAKWRTAFMGQ
ncbi:hypothetical protein ALC56_14820 [Trachymyrmex septentrionalis]|uniref:Uncharacterized protein n=1 Tax=Trachymyrmex septentrionalis TaxID=34720 RepID=A0A195ES02_9HYME|nr:hypothetical protein ALC56_14820 [Trachymyrmex septentrionalis]